MRFYAYNSMSSNGCQPVILPAESGTYLYLDTELAGRRTSFPSARGARRGWRGPSRPASRWSSGSWIKTGSPEPTDLEKPRGSPGDRVRMLYFRLLRYFHQGFPACPGSPLRPDAALLPDRPEPADVEEPDESDREQDNRYRDNYSDDYRPFHVRHLLSSLPR